MSLSDLGTELEVLVYHLYNTKKNWFRELCLRTKVALDKKDEASAKAPSQLPQTAWFSTMHTRRGEMYREIREKQKDNIDEIKGLVTDMYPKGCSLSEYADVVQTCASLASFTVPSDLIRKTVAEQGDALQKKGVHTLSVEELSENIVVFLIVESFVPSRWWTTSDSGAFTVTRVGLVVQPAGMIIEYKDSDRTTRHRTIRFGNLFSPNGPTSTLARRLCETHDCLLAEADIQKHLVRLQRLTKQALEEADMEKETAVQKPAETADAPSKAPAETVVESQKADLGLLYRDPEKSPSKRGF
ncbi:hypothetical protein AGDE_10854 [Angomonas deanei]|nr:hypothetical protein AGDE_10854 [Angomonas deanei]|eukprot:EPY27261.1 hypothetical protein AGDE_10854 [Angomonas deanei]